MAPPTVVETGCLLEVGRGVGSQNGKEQTLSFVVPG